MCPTSAILHILHFPVGLALFVYSRLFPVCRVVENTVSIVSFGHALLRDSNTKSITHEPLTQNCTVADEEQIKKPSYAADHFPLSHA
jgi:hypothetical protein